MSEGLSGQDWQSFRELLVKANGAQLTRMMMDTKDEHNKRYRRMMFKEFGSYGNEAIGYSDEQGRLVKQ